MKTKKSILALAGLAISLVLAGLLGAYLGKIQAARTRTLEDKILQSASLGPKLGQAKPNKNKLQEVEEIELVAVGDLMFHMPQVNGASYPGGYDFTSSFEYIGEFLESDLLVGNLETNLREDAPYSGYPRFNSPVELARDLGQVGFRLLNINNNHSLDMGLEGLISTMDQLRINNIDYIGANYRGKDKHLIKEIDGIRLGFLSYSYGFNGMDGPLGQENTQAYINKIDPLKIQADIQAIRSESDLVIVYIHWGEEYITRPNQDQEVLAKNMMEWGANIILGSHPHVIQRAELIDDRHFIIYSMGNFLSNQSQESSGSNHVKDGLVLRLGLKRDQLDSQVKISQVEFMPTWVHKYFRDSRTYHQIIPIEKVLEGKIQVYGQEAIENQLRNSYNRTMEIINKN